MEKVDTNSTSVDAKEIKIAEDKLSATFQLKSKITKGTYKMTVTDGEETATKEIATTDDAATQIVIKSTQALTNSEFDVPVADGGTAKYVAGHEAYIYYDVINAYNESVRGSVSLTWSTSAGEPDDDPAKGKLTVYKGGDDISKAFMYNEDIVVVAVDPSTGLSVNETIKVGMPQKIDKVDFAGFIDTKSADKLLATLPVNFAKDRYLLAYQAMDQDGNEIEIDGNEQQRDVTFIGDNPMLIDAGSLKYEIDGAKPLQTPEYTIDGKTYYTITVQPGMYSDKGGEVNITAIANNTGTKTVKNFVVGSAAILKKLTLLQPELVATGDQDVNIPFEAIDTAGNKITNYEAIVRSTNTLSFKCTRGRIVVKENNDGTAAILWNDSKAADAYTNTTADILNKNGQMTSISTIVVGGEASNLIINLKEARYPSQIEKVDTKAAVVDGSPIEANICSDDDHGWHTNVWFADQFGKSLDRKLAYAFFNAGTLSDGYNYNVLVSKKSSGAYATGRDGYMTNAAGGDWDSKQIGYKFNATNTSDSAAIETLEFTIHKTKGDKTTTVGKSVTKNVEVVPFSMVKGSAKIKDISKLYIPTAAGNYNTLTDYAVAEADGMFTSGNINFKQPVSPSDLPVSLADTQNEAKVSFVGKYKGNEVDIANSHFVVDTSSVVKVADGKVSAISGGSIEWADLYDSTGKGTRKDATKTLKMVSTDSDPVTVAKDVVFSDAPRKVASIALCNNWRTIAVDGDKVTVNPTSTNFSFKITQPTHNVWDNYTGDAWYYDGRQFEVKDQYGQKMDGKRAAISVSIEDYVESTSELTHMPNNATIDNNNTHNAMIKGAEIGDTFKVTISVDGVKATYNVTVGADRNSVIGDTEGAAIENDTTFRKASLGYKN